MGKFSLMNEIDRALDIVIEKVPDLAGDAANAKRRASRRIKLKNAVEVLTAALGSTAKLTAGDRKLFAACISATTDSKRKDVTIPPIRVSAEQLAELEAEAEKSGSTMSDIIRNRLFPK